MEYQNLKQDMEDIKSLLILLLRANKVDNKDIAKALGMSEGRISQILDKKKYPRKNEKPKEQRNSEDA